MVAQKMEVKALLALPKGFEVTSIEGADDVLTIAVVSTQAHPTCPLCASQASRVHSHYMRTVADLPCVGQQVRLLVQVRKFFCDVTSCPRKIFVERIAPFVEPWARVTARLHQTIQIIGLATGGMLGARVTDRLGIQTCWMTIIRRIMALPTAPVEAVAELGIDDFSFRRGRKFGTILVDMQSHQVIDLLPDRKKETAAVCACSASTAGKAVLLSAEAAVVCVQHVEAQQASVAVNGCSFPRTCKAVLA
jgi:transposase